MQSARRKADALAALSKAKIVRIASSREIAAASSATSGSNMGNMYLSMVMAELGGSGGGENEDGSSNELKPIPVNVTLEVQFVTGGQ
jgi:hypothetical protein